VARRNGSGSVKEKIRTVRHDMTEVAVQCGCVGHRDRKTTELIHATIFDAI